MSYQKCPICQGSGNNPVAVNTESPCRTCEGTGIISELTGLPPQKPPVIKEPIKRGPPAFTEIDSETQKDFRRKVMEDWQRQQEEERERRKEIERIFPNFPGTDPRQYYCPLPFFPPKKYWL